MRARALVLASLAIALAFFAMPSRALAGPPPQLRVDLVPLPSHFSEADESDRLQILVSNPSALPAGGGGEPLVVHVTPQANVIVGALFGNLWAPAGEGLTCSPQPRSEAPQCALDGPLPSGGTIAIVAEVAVTAPAGVASLAVEVEHGGSWLARESAEVPIGSTPVPFAIESFSFDSTAADGTQLTQAAGHPYEQVVSFELPSDATANSQEAYRPARNPRAVSFALPSGFLGDPLAASRCPPRALEEGRILAGEQAVPCPPGSQIGLVTLLTGRNGGAVGTHTGQGAVSALYNLKPEPGHPAELGFSYQGHAVVLYVDVAFIDGHYVLRVSMPGMPIVDLDGIVLTLFGDPGAQGEEPGAQGEEPGAQAAFLTNPDSCAPGGTGARLEVDSWEAPRQWLASALAPPALSGCELLKFSPRLEVTPRPGGAAASDPGVAADTPTGFDLGVAVPEADSPWGSLPSPRLRELTLTMPPGVSISPAAANGLRACAASGPEGIGLPRGSAHPDEAGEGEEIGADGLSHLTPGRCPASSVLGSVQLRTPLLESPLTGSLYLAAPACGVRSPCGVADAEAGEMVRVYLEARGEGVELKFPGTVEVGGPGASGSPSGLESGQLRLHFGELPDLPLSEVSVHLAAGPRALLSTPETCGARAATGRFVSWAGPVVPPVSGSSAVTVTSGAGGGACPANEGSEPNDPTVQAGTQRPVAGAFTPFTLSLARADGSQRLRSFAAALPPGLLARLVGVGRCPDAAIAAAEARMAGAEEAAPDCPAAAEIGSVRVTAGPGPLPLPLQGPAFLAGPYKGAPLSLAILTPAIAGPFDLGTLVTRVALYVDERTAQIRAISDPLPASLAGIPLDVRSIALRLDRPRLTLNPTNCAERQIGVTVTSIPGSVAQLANRFQVGGCGRLPFKPRPRLLLSGQTGRSGDPALKAVLTQPPGDTANIARVSATLPAGLLIDSGHLHAPCSRLEFSSTAVPGEACPQGSVLGHAEVWTPLLEEPEEGSVYLRSNGGERRLPDIAIALRGPIPVQLLGFVDAVRGRRGHGSRLRVRFPSVPDVPVSRFELKLAGGAKGPFENGHELCHAPNRGSFDLTGQNGKRSHASSKARVRCA